MVNEKSIEHVDGKKGKELMKEVTGLEKNNDAIYNFHEMHDIWMLKFKLDLSLTLFFNFWT